MRLAGRGALAACLALTACFPRPGVLRVQDDAFVLGPTYEPPAYAYALAGAMAESDGRYAEAARAYDRALGEAPGDPELSTRLYHASCFAAAPGRFDEPKARKSLQRAMDRGYAPAYVALAECVTRQGSRGDAEALRLAREGISRTARDPDEVLRAGKDSEGSELRNGVLVIAHPEAREPYLALAESLEKAGKRLAAATAYADYARLQPSARRSMLGKAEQLEAAGEGFGARLLAAAALDAPAVSGAPLGALPPAALRLAIDEAILRGDERAVLRRASRGRVGLGEVAARAWLVGDRALAERLARSVLEAGHADADAAAVMLCLGLVVPMPIDGAPSESGRRVLERAVATLTR